MEHMNDEEKQLLSFLKDTDDLSLYGQESLRQLRVILAYLKRKYPSLQMEYRYFEPHVKTVEKGVLAFCIKGSDILHKAIIRKTSGGEVCMDDLWGELIQKDYDEALCQLLSLFTGPVFTHTVFFTMGDERVNGVNALRLSREYHPSFARHSDVFVSAAFECTELVRFQLAESGFFGSYTVYLVPAGWQMPKDISKRFENVKELMTFRIQEKDYGYGG